MATVLNQRILHADLFTPSPEGFWGLPILGEGEPGTGKTHNLIAVARLVNLVFKRLSPGECGEGQFGVVPVPGADGFLHYPPPDWVESLKDGGILFLDEINTAPPALQAPLLGLVQLRTIGNHKLGSRVRVLAAQNSTEDAAGGWDLAPPLANRFGHFTFEGLDPETWATAILSGFGAEEVQATNAVAEEERVMAAWPGAIAMARGLVAGFIRRRPELLHVRPRQADKNASKSWPSRRTVEYATHALASSAVHGLSETDTDTFMEAFVGLAWVREFATWKRDLDMPVPGDLLDGKVTFTHDDRRIDRTVAVLGACAALVVPDKAEKKIDRGIALWQLLAQLRKDAPDAIMPAAHALCKARMIAGKYKTDKVLSDMMYLLVEAGIAGQAAA